MTVLVKQRMASDCGPCCLAMLTGKPIDDVISTIGDVFDPNKGMRSTYTALERLGFSNEDFSCLHRGFEISPEFFRRLAWKRRALFSIPSLNIPNGWHMIYVDGKTIFDPCLNKIYTKWRDLKPQEITLFNEGPA